MAFFGALIIISCTPLKCGPAGGLKCQLILWVDVTSWILFWSKASNSFNSLLPPTKLVPLSQTTSLGTPSRDVIRKNASRNESVSRLYATSRCTALFSRQVNRHKYLFWRVFPLPCLIMKGPPKSRSTLAVTLVSLLQLEYLCGCRRSSLVRARNVCPLFVLLLGTAYGLQCLVLP